MQAIYIISFLVLSFTANVQADITLRYDRMRGDQVIGQHKVLLKQDRVRISSRSPRQQDFMLNLKTGDIIQLSKQQKSYFTINTQTLNQYVSLYRQNQGLFQGLIAQGISQLDPQQRQRMQQMMKNFTADGADSGFRLIPARRSKQILGVRCALIQMWNGKRHVRDICMASYKDLQLPPADVQRFEQLKKLVVQFRQQAAGDSDWLGRMAKGLEQLPGLPMELTELQANGKIRQVTRLASISQRKIPAEIYRIPAGYQQKMMPLM